VALHHYPNLALPSKGLWVWLGLFLTWGFLAYTIYFEPTQIKSEIPEFDNPNSGILLGGGQDSANSCYEQINGKALLVRQLGYKIAIGCFFYDGKEDILDAPYLQVGNLYDIKDGVIFVRATYQPYFIDYLKQMHSLGIMVALFNVPNGVQPNQFATLRQARSLGVKILQISQAASASVAVQTPSPPTN
jgi:hypothetical protein